MSHDTDKLIRQLSLVAFLMAERRPLTAREIKSVVEGYSEMSDEAFARRFYSDRSELVALGVPLHSQRDEFTGEELYTLRSEQYFLPELDLDDDELAALQTALHLLDGQFAYAEPLRLALQNLALGRPTQLEAAPESALRVEVRDPDYSDEMSGRLTKLEGAISKQRTVKFTLLVDHARPDARAHGQPVRAPPRGGLLVPDRARPGRGRRAHVPGLPDRRRHPLRHAARARLPHAGVRPVRLPRPPALAVRRGQGRGRDRARPRHRLVGRAHGRARRGRGRRLHDAVLAASTCSPAGSSARRAARGRSRRPSWWTRSAQGLDRVLERHEGEPTKPPRPKAQPEARAARAPGRPGRARALRRPPGAARPPARPLRRRDARDHPRAGARRPLPHPVRPARRPPAAPQPRQLRRRLLRRLRLARRRRGARREGALRRRLPAPAAADAARGARDPARARVRRADDRRRGADAARARPPEARGDLRRVRHARDRPSPRRAPRRRSSSARSRRRSASSGSSRSSTWPSARRRASA